MQQKWNAKLLAFGTAPPQALWCATEVKNFDDLKGKKLRVYTKTMVDFTQGIGAAPVNIAFREVITALQNKVVDCAVTGTSVGNSAGWTEVTKYLMPISLGWAINVHVVNLTTWKRLDPKVQAFLEGEFRKFEDKFWQIMKETDADAANCNVGKQPCRNGKLANMIMVPVSDADQLRFKKTGAGHRGERLAQARRRGRREGMERDGRQGAGHGGDAVGTRCHPGQAAERPREPGPIFPGCAGCAMGLGSRPSASPGMTVLIRQPFPA